VAVVPPEPWAGGAGGRSLRPGGLRMTIRRLDDDEWRMTKTGLRASPIAALGVSMFHFLVLTIF
jgi:hypothetical protein